MSSKFLCISIAIEPLSADPPNSSGALSLPKDFDNLVKLFPLPNVVLFPGVVQALHIFEPRYRQLAEDAIATDELITLAMVDVDKTMPEDPRPELLPTVCIGKIVSHNQLEDGRYNLLLVGASRARIVNEIVSDHPYRIAEVKVQEDSANYAPADVESLTGQVLDLFRDLVERQRMPEVESLSRLFEGDLPLGQVSDLIGYACGANSIQQYQILEEPEVCRRAEILIKLLRSLIAGATRGSNSSDDFPPRFSNN